ncbi:MAG: hypothetical protein VX289_02735, partial [Candidatus Poribacteria bacterium]|nr:hypothetical protein [Candidatus Poribacteria bacterium]
MSWRLIGIFTISVTATVIFILVVFTGLNLERNEQPSSIETLRSSSDSEQNYQKALESIDIFVLDRDGFELIPEQIE